MDRRNFLGNSFGGLACLLVGQAFSPLLKVNEALAEQHVQSLIFRITEAQKEMVTHNELNKALCSFWIYKEERFPADCPGPIIVAVEGDEINVSLHNALDVSHSFFINGVVNSGAVLPGKTRNFSFVAPAPGTYLYYDNLNEPVNRMMGLHGALVVMPKSAVMGNKFTPYSSPTPAIQRLFNDFGTSYFPGLAWEEGDHATHTPPFRQYVWLLHEVSPVLFNEVANSRCGRNYTAAEFLEAFTNDAYANSVETGRMNRKPHFFTINGQSGFFSHHNPFITPWRRVGEPLICRVLNAGLYTHSLHLHANHYYVLALNNQAQSNLLLVDTYQVNSLETFDCAVPMRRPPDVPNERAIGFPDTPLKDLKGNPVWPPSEEMNLHFPKVGDPLSVQMSPLCYPMHDHVEVTQTAEGANHSMGMMSGVNFIGDRTILGAMNFPNQHHSLEEADLSETRASAPPIPH